MQYFMVWGTVAFVITILLFMLSVFWMIRKTGYEFLRKAHHALALVYVGVCIVLISFCNHFIPRISNFSCWSCLVPFFLS